MDDGFTTCMPDARPSKRKCRRGAANRGPSSIEPPSSQGTARAMCIALRSAKFHPGTATPAWRAPRSAEAHLTMSGKYERDSPMNMTGFDSSS